MLSNLSNNNSGNPTKNVVEKKHYEDIEKRLDEMQDEIEMTEEGVRTNSQAIASLDGRVAVVEDNSTFPELNTNTINPATGNKVDVTGNLDVDGAITADFANFGELSVNGTNFNTVKDDAAQAKSIAETANNKADEAYDLADAVADELADYKADNEASITTGTLNADSVVTDSIAAQTINTNDFETTNAEIDKLYVDTIKATGFLELPTAGQQYYTITVPAKTTASFSGVYTSDNNTDYPFYFTVSDGAVIYKQGSTEIIKDISFDRETGYTKVRVKSSTNLTYISSALDSNPVTIEDGGEAYTDYAFIPQKTGGYLIRGYDDTTTEIYIAGVLRAYAMSVEEEIIERTSVDFLKVNASIELPKEWDAGGTISYSTGEENEYISAQKKAGVVKPTWTSPIHSTIGSLSYSSKLVDEATVASYKGISETRQTQTISITNEASLQQLTAFHWTKNGTYWQPYEVTRITIGDNTMWIDPTEANQGIRFNNNQVIADGTWNDVPVEEANAVPVNLVIFDAPTELSFPITNLGDKTTVHGSLTVTDGITGTIDNAICLDGDTKAVVLDSVKCMHTTTQDMHCAACIGFDTNCYPIMIAQWGASESGRCSYVKLGCSCATMTDGRGSKITADNFGTRARYCSESGCSCVDISTSEVELYTKALDNPGEAYVRITPSRTTFCNKSSNKSSYINGDQYSGNAATATNANNADNFDGKDYATVKADILSGNAASATNATCFDGHTYACAKADILSGNAASATNATCFNGKTYAEAKTDILSGCAADSNKFNNKDYATACADILKGKACTSCLADCACTVERAQSNSSSAIPVVLTDAATAADNGQILVDCDNKLTYTPSTDTLCTGNLEATADVKAANVCGSTLVKGAALCSTGDLNVDGDAYITGDLTVQGTITTTHSEEVVTPSENIILRDGATTPIASGCYSGFTVTNYDGQDNDLEVGADKDGTLHVGVVGGTMEPIATRATEACMEDGYAAHWDSTGTDLVTKGATNTHDLCINGDATATGTITGTFSGNLTGNVTGNVIGNLTGNADTATNSTCFDGCTYACAKKDILSGCAADSNKLAGKTYAQTKADILSGHAASASYATKVVPFCAAEDEEKNLAFFNCNVDCGNPDTIQYDSGKNLTFNPVSNNLTVAGDVKAKNAVRKGEYYNTSSDNVGKYVLLAQASYAYNGNHDVGIFGYLTKWSTVSNRFALVARVSGTTVQQSSLSLLLKTDGIKGTYDFDATSATITIRLYAKIDGQYQRFKIAIDNFTKGDVYPFASTYDSALTLPMTVSATMTGTEITTTYMKVESSTSADNSTCFNGCTYAQACSDIRSGLISDIGIDVNCGDTCVCTLNNGSTLALSANAFNENAKISTDDYPGAYCTGTSNYVVTTMVCCAKQICRNPTHVDSTCHVALFGGNTNVSCAGLYVADTCPLTYNPATGEIKTACAVLSNMSIANIYGVYCANASASTCYPITLIARCFDANKCPTNYAFGFHANGCMTANTVYSTAFQNAPVALCHTPANTNPVWINVGWINPHNTTNSSQSLELHVGGAGIVDTATIDIHLASAEGPTWTIRHPTRYGSGTGFSCLCLTKTGAIWNCAVTLWAQVKPYAANTSFEVNLYKKNVTNWNDGMSVATGGPTGTGILSSALPNDINVFTGTVCANCVRGATRVIAGNPTACTSTQLGGGGGCLGGGIELYHTTPFIDFHVNNACADFSHRLQANDGYLRLTATNATGCCAATQTASFDFTSDGRFGAACNISVANTSYKFNVVKSDNSARPVLFLLTDITCAVCCSAVSASVIGKACRNRCGSSQILTNGSIEFNVAMPYGSTGVENATVHTHLSCGSGAFPVVATKPDGCVYAGLIVYGSAQAVTFDLIGSSGVICQVCADANNVYKDASGCTFTIAKTGSLAQITSCVSNAVCATNATSATNSTCFGGCTYAQAKADFLSGTAGSANKIVSDTVEIVGCNCNNDTLLCINPTTDHCCIFIGSVLPYSGSGLDNYIPVSIGCNNCVLSGVAIGTCSCSDGGVAIGQYTKAWRGGPTASGNAVAIGYGVMSEDAGVAIGGGSKACRRAVAIGHGAQVCCSCGFGVAIGPTSIAGQAATALGHFTTACDYATALGCGAKAEVEGSLAIGRCSCSEIICDIRYSTIVTMDSSVYGRHGEIDITIPSCLVKCDIWKGLCGIYHSMNNGRTLCSWTCSSCTDIPIMRSSFFGYVWDAAGTTDGTKRYSSGVDATGTCYGNFNVILDDQSCLNYTLSFMLGACHCPIEIGNMRFDRSDTSTWVCGLSGKIIF